MSKFNILYNEFSQQFITLPLTLKNVSGEGMIVDSIRIQNIVDNNQASENDILFYFDETLSDYTQAEKLYTATYNVLHSGFIFVNQNLKKKDKINFVFSLDNTKEFNFVVVFNPNINKNNVRKGAFNAKIKIFFQSVSSGQNKEFEFNVEGESSDKIVAKIQNVPYNNINSIFDIQRSQIINLN